MMHNQPNPMIPNAEQISQAALAPRLKYPDPVDRDVDTLLKQWVSWHESGGSMDRDRDELVRLAKETQLEMAKHGIATREQILWGTTIRPTRNALPGIVSMSYDAPPICGAQLKALQEIGEWARYRLDALWPGGIRYFNDAIELVRGAVEWAQLMREDEALQTA